MSCIGMRLGILKRRGKASLEYYDENDKPVYYCEGYIDKMTDELIPVCAKCRQNVKYAQEDLDNQNKRKAAVRTWEPKHPKEKADPKKTIDTKAYVDLSWELFKEGCG